MMLKVEIDDLWCLMLLNNPPIEEDKRKQFEEIKSKLRVKAWKKIKSELDRMEKLASI